MEHVVAILTLGLLCLVWAVVHQLADGRGCTGTCDGCARGVVDAAARSATERTPSAPPAPAAPPRPSACWRRRLRLALALAVGLALGGWAAWRLLGEQPGSPPATIRVTRPLMGTLWTIEVIPTRGQASTEVAAAVEAAFSEVARIEGVMSEWRPETPISAVNASAGHGLVEVPAELRELIERGVGWGKRSDGAFDISWRGMGRIWRVTADDFVVPTSDEVEAARRRVDYRKVLVEGDRVGLAEEGMALGLGGIAKGYAVDRAAQVLLDRGVTSFSVAGAGDIRLHGTNADGEPWRVGVRDPRGGPGDVLDTLRIAAGAVSTSGDYERFREVDGVRYHHIIDPRTGHPARACRSVTVVAPLNETADVLATAVFVLGPEKGLALVATTPGASALVIDADGGRHESPGLPR